MLSSSPQQLCYHLLRSMVPTAIMLCLVIEAGIGASLGSPDLVQQQREENRIINDKGLVGIAAATAEKRFDPFDKRFDLFKRFSPLDKRFDLDSLASHYYDALQPGQQLPMKRFDYDQQQQFMGYPPPVGMMSGFGHQKRFDLGYYRPY